MTMAVPLRDSLEDLEKYRLQLEINVAKLRKALQHWQTWEAEYECLREEIQALPADARGDVLLQAAGRVEGELLNQNEINELLTQDKQTQRSASQVCALVSRRIEYVHRNVEALQKQVDAADVTLAGVAVVLQPEANTEDGLPVTEIYEELDEDGNVISGRTSRPGEAASEVLDMLEKVGVQEEDIRDREHGITPIGSIQKDILDTTNDKADAVHEPLPVTIETAVGITTRPRKKSVSFAEGTKQPHNDEKSSSATQPVSGSAVSLSEETPPNPSDLQWSVSNIVDVDVESREVPAVSPIIPTDESPEDAAMRREMLQYHMSEIGAIVAQLDLDEDEKSDSGYDDEASNLDSTSVTDEENEYGMSMNRGIDEDYTAQMLQLEKKLGVQMFQNIGPHGDDSVEDVQRIGLQSKQPSSDLNTSNTVEKTENITKEKTVRFADKLDVAPAPAGPQTTVDHVRETVVSPPMSEKIFERPIVNPSSIVTAPQPAKPSRFKAARMAQTVVSSTGAQSGADAVKLSPTPLASRIIEHRPSAENPSARPPSPDEFDPALLRQEVATEYYRQRNRMIQKEGGFSRQRQDEQDMEDSIYSGEGDDPDIEDVDDYEVDEIQPEPEVKVSLFKAARLKKTALQ